MNETSEPAKFLDLDQLAVFADFGLEDFKEILDDAIADVPGLLSRLKAAMMSGDEEEGKRTAHLLRGMLLNFGCATLANRLLEIEREWVAPEKGEEIAQELEDIWQNTLESLEAWVSTTFQSH